MRKSIALAKCVGYIAACFTAGVYVGEGIVSFIQKSNSVAKTLLATVGGIGTIAFLDTTLATAIYATIFPTSMSTHLSTKI